MKRSYVPVVSLLLVIFFAHSIIDSRVFNPLLAAQNKRISFQGAGEAAKASDLTPGESELAEQVVKKDRVIDRNRGQLLYVGNSQTMAMMDQNPGDMISPQWFQILLARSQAENLPTIQVSMGSLPNLTMSELLVRIVAARESKPRQGDIVIASAVLEELRGLSVRKEIADVAEAPGVKARLLALVKESPDLVSVRGPLTEILEDASTPESSSASDSTRSSYAKIVESRLQKEVERLPVFSDRALIQGLISLTYYDWRNKTLGITSASPRPVPESAYRGSLEMLELALRYAKSEHVRMIVYLAPIRPIQPNPNLASDVFRFRKDVPAICARYGVTCLDYVDLVPESLWTNYPDDASGSKGQRDYAHFTGAGHKLVAETLFKDVAQDLGARAQEPR